MDFLNAVRIVFDPTILGDSRINVDNVRLVMFGAPGERHVRNSINDSENTSWYTPFVKNQDFSKISVSDLKPDPTHVNVFYLVYKGEETALNGKIMNHLHPVHSYIHKILTDLDRMMISTNPGEFQTVSPTNRREGFLEKMSTDVYFTHILTSHLLLSFLRLLRSPREGFDDNGFRKGIPEEEQNSQDFLVLSLAHERNFDHESTELYVSRATKEM